jgi:hypothetical protein
MRRSAVRICHGAPISGDVMSHGGKGDKPRPLSVPIEQFDNRWETIFGKKKKPEDEKVVESKEEKE